MADSSRRGLVASPGPAAVANRKLSPVPGAVLQQGPDVDPLGALVPLHLAALLDLEPLAGGEPLQGRPGLLAPRRGTGPAPPGAPAELGHRRPVAGAPARTRGYGKPSGAWTLIRPGNSAAGIRGAAPRAASAHSDRPSTPNGKGWPRWIAGRRVRSRPTETGRPASRRAPARTRDHGRGAVAAGWGLQGEPQAQGGAVGVGLPGTPSGAPGPRSRRPLIRACQGAQGPGSAGFRRSRSQACSSLRDCSRSGSNASRTAGSGRPAAICAARAWYGAESSKGAGIGAAMGNSLPARARNARSAWILGHPRGFPRGLLISLWGSPKFL